MYYALSNLSFAFLFFFMAYAVFEWSRIWWWQRRYGMMRVSLGSARLQTTLSRWENSYLGFKIWTWVASIFGVLVALWQFTMGALLVMDAIFEVVT